MKLLKIFTLAMLCATQAYGADSFVKTMPESESSGMLRNWANKICDKTPKQTPKKTLYVFVRPCEVPCCMCMERLYLEAKLYEQLRNEILHPTRMMFVKKQ
jgi:hypothetical protein